MPNITITFSFPINVSVQVGDTAYYTSNTTPLGTHIHSDWDPSPATALYPNSDDFIMFSKDNKANLSSLLGYYAEVKFVNNSPDEAELFSVGTEIFGSSK